MVHSQPIQNPSCRETISCHSKEDDPLEECILIFTAYGQQFIAYLQTVPDQCLHMSEVYDAGTMDPDEVAFGQLAPDRCEVERNYEAATSCQVDAGITSGSLYPLDFIHCRFEIVVLPPDKDILPLRTSLVDVSFFSIGRTQT